MNRLADETSLYLRQHAENPVDWYPWGDEAFARARDLKRPVLLSIGYSACHWCHVMAHESFEDEATAALMNELFVCVKVDREERPDVDALYMQATLALSGSGGWPMTVFLTPDARPFFAGTYFPPTGRQGMPSFSDLCRSIAEAYESRPDDVEAQAAEVTSRLTQAAVRTGNGRAFTPSLVDDALVGLARTFDPRMGGFGGAPKFPPSLALEFLVRRARRRPDDVNAREMAELTLRRMADGGICDQIGGGFHRYSVDAVWLVPHFEKMLYDNALLARAYTLAFELTGDAQMQRVAESTLDYLLREMRVEGGAFAAAQDADSEGGEGAFFVWTPEQLDELLTADEVRAATLHYGVTEPGNFEGATIPYLALPLDAVAQQIGGDPVPLIESARAKLYAARSTRPAPGRDDKVITAWNGLAIAALADAGRILGRDDYLDAARAAARFLLTQMITDGRLRRTGRHPGQLDDHADLCHGLLQLYDATFEPEWLVAARQLADKMVELFADTEGSGFLYAGNDSEVLLAPTRDLEDHPTPAGNSQAAWVLLRLASLTGDTDFEARAIAALDLVGADLVRFPHAFGTALVAIDHVAHDRREVAVVGPRDDPRTIALLDTARSDGGPGTALAWGDPADPTFAAQVPLLADRTLVAGEPAAYVCRQFACQAPVTTPEALRAFLS